MSEGDLPQPTEEGGRLLSSISNEFVQMQKQYWGLGPVSVKSYMMDDLLLIVMRGGLTRAEHTMLEFDEEDLVRNFRQTFENKMTQILKDKVERLTGRKVLTYQSQILVNPDLVAELFVFDRAASGAEEIEATAGGQLAAGGPLGEVTDETGASTQPAPTDDPQARSENTQG